MRSPRLQETSLEPASSPPAAAAGPSDREAPEGTLLYSSPPDQLDEGLSPTQTLAASSPELPPLPPFPSLTSVQKTPVAGKKAAGSEKGYYTASWGSPYQKLPPGYTDSSRGRKASSALSSDVEDTSPHPFDLSRLVPSRLPTYSGLTPTRPSTPTGGVRTVRDALLTARSCLDKNLVADKGSWPSDASSFGERRSSQGSLDEWDLSTLVLKTPVGIDRTRKSLGHKGREDNLTVRQEDVWEALGKTPKGTVNEMQHSKYAQPLEAQKASQTIDGEPSNIAGPENDGARSPPTAEETASIASKSMENLAPASSAPQTAKSSPTKKRVNCKGKTLTILLPAQTPRGTDGQPLIPLSDSELRAKLDVFERAGYDTRGFNHWHGATQSFDPVTQAQNRDVYPVPSDIANLSSRPTVKIPNQKDFDDYAKLVMEQKLRALGVSLGDEPAPSPQPGSASLSRQPSSQYPNSTFSPPPLSSSAASLQHGRNLPGGFVPGHMARQSMASPVSSIGNPRSMGHMSRQSMFVSPPSAHMAPTPPGLQRWSPQPFVAQNGGARTASPAISALSPGPLSAGGAKSPVSPFQFPTSQHFPFGAREDLLQQMQKQQQQVQTQQEAQGVRPPPVLQGLQEEPEPEEEQPLEKANPQRPEIANPRPRHSKNVSVQLERDVGKDGYHLEDYIKKQYLDEQTAEETEVTKDESKPSESEKPATKPDETPIPVSKIASTAGGTPPSVSKSEEDSFDSITSPTTESFTTSGHVSKASSVSKFNVDAKEFKFNPSASFNSSVFSPTAFSFQPSASQSSFTPAASLNGFDAKTKHLESKSPPSTGPTFTGDFNFTSAHTGFKPDAPAFNPTFAFGSGNEGESKGKIFSNINFSDIVKPVKKSKAIPIVKPEPPLPSAHDEPQEDESGRLGPADGRQKRARRGGDDGDDAPLFAFPSHPLDDKTPEPEPVAKEGSATPTNDPAVVQQLTTPESVSAKLDDSGFQEGQSETSLFQRLSTAVDKDGPPIQKPTHGRTKSSLSATAKPFVFKPWVMNDAEPKTESELDTSEVEAELESDPDDDNREMVVDLAQQMKDQLPSASSPILSLSDQETAQAVIGGHGGSKAEGEDFNFDERADLEDINEVMNYMNDEGSELGVERFEDVWQQQSSSRPPTANTYDTPELRPPQVFRSDAPSPSPRRSQYLQQEEQLDEEDSAESSGYGRNPFGDQAAEAYESGARVPLLEQHVETQIETQASDWDEVMSSNEAEKLRLRSRFFDNHVDTLLKNALSSRLGPLELTMQAIQTQLNALSDRNASRRPQRRLREDSDADDEDESEEDVGSSVRARSVPRDRRMDKIKAVVQEAIASHQSRQKTPPREDGRSIDPTEFYQAIADVKASAAFFASKSIQLDEVRVTVEEALSKQKLETSERGAALASLGPEVQQISELAKDLADANTRAEMAVEAQRLAESREANAVKQLGLAEEELRLLKANSLDEEDKLKIFNMERQALKEALRDLEDEHNDKEKKLSSLAKQNAALEATIGEYRISHENWRQEHDRAHAERDKMQSTLEAMQFQAQEAMRIRESMRGRLSSLREEMKNAANQMAQQQAKWQREDEEHRKRYEVLTARLGAEARTRERFEQEMERLEAQEREGYRLKAQLAEARDAGHAEVQRTRVLLQAQIEAANNQVNIVRADLEAQLARRDAELENVKMDMDTAKERHELMLEQEADARRDAAQLYEQRLEELRQRHARAVAHAQEERQVYETRIKEEHKRLTDDKHSSEMILNDKLALADSKIEHLQDKVAHLEERLEVAKSAAAAAAAAAQSAKSPTAVVQAAAAAAQPSTASGSKLPEKISPQALRESIAVLQEQLQEREGRIEELQTAMDAIDKDAPAKLKERETEINWLRELLGVRSDDLAELINTLARPAFDREAVRTAAIRIRTNLQMELQERERLANGGIGAQVLPAIASLSNFASPKAAQLAAAIGNWRKQSAASGTPSGLGLSAESPSSSGTQTPSKTSASAHSFLSGLMTPPQSNLRRTPSPSASARPLRDTEMVRPGSSASTVTSRVNVSPRSTRRAEKQPQLRGLSPPPRLGTPPLLRKTSYDQDAESAHGDFSSQGFYEDESALTAGGEDEAPPFETFGAAQ